MIGAGIILIVIIYWVGLFFKILLASSVVLIYLFERLSVRQIMRRVILISRQVIGVVDMICLIMKIPCRVVNRGVDLCNRLYNTICGGSLIVIDSIEEVQPI